MHAIRAVLRQLTISSETILRTDHIHFSKNHPEHKHAVHYECAQTLPGTSFRCPSITNSVIMSWLRVGRHFFVIEMSPGGIEMKIQEKNPVVSADMCHIVLTKRLCMYSIPKKSVVMFMMLNATQCLQSYRHTPHIHTCVRTIMLTCIHLCMRTFAQLYPHAYMFACTQQTRVAYISKFTRKLVPCMGNSDTRTYLHAWKLAT